MSKLLASAVLLVTAVLLSPAWGVAMTTNASQIAQNPAAFNGEHVDVRGVASQVEQRTLGLNDHYETFLVCGSACIPVVAFGWPDVAEGLPIVVHGTFQSAEHIDGYVFYNSIRADDGSL
jgi:hypothetical protein